MTELLALGISLTAVLAGFILMALLAYKLIKRKGRRYSIVGIGIILIAVSSVIGFILVAFGMQQTPYSLLLKIIEIFAIVYIAHGIISRESGE